MKAHVGLFNGTHRTECGSRLCAASILEYPRFISFLYLPCVLQIGTCRCQLVLYKMHGEILLPKDDYLHCHILCQQQQQQQLLTMGRRISDIFYKWSEIFHIMSCWSSPYLDRTYYLSETVSLLQLIILDISSCVDLLCLYNIIL
jgi:hypothetical protein